MFAARRQEPLRCIACNRAKNACRKIAKPLFAIKARDRQIGAPFPPALCRPHLEFLSASSVDRDSPICRIAVAAEPASASQRQDGLLFPPVLCRSHPEFLWASFLSRFGPFDHGPSVGVVHDERIFWQSLGDQRAVSIRIIVNDRHVCQCRKLERPAQ